MRRAGARYQRTFAGAVHHAARQKRWRRRRCGEEKVTHQGIAVALVIGTVASSSMDVGGCDERMPDDGSRQVFLPGKWARCAFCGRRLGVWVRLGPLRGGP
jgi:ribosomal protein L34E